MYLNIVNPLVARNAEKQFFISMRGSRNFRQGGPGQHDKKSSDVFFWVFFQGGGGVQLLIPYRNPYNLWFSRGGPDPLSPPLDPHLIRTGSVLIAIQGQKMGSENSHCTQWFYCLFWDIAWALTQVGKKSPKLGDGLGSCKIGKIESLVSIEQPNYIVSYVW